MQHELNIFLLAVYRLKHPYRQRCEQSVRCTCKMLYQSTHQFVLGPTVLGPTWPYTSSRG